MKKVSGLEVITTAEDVGVAAPCGDSGKRSASSSARCIS